MDNSQTLELQIKSKTQEAKASVESLVKSLTNVENVLTNIYLEMGSIEKKTDSSINKSTTAAKNINQLKQSTDKATSSADKLGNAFKKAFTFAGVKRLTTTALGWANEAIDYTEQLNLFNVVFDNTEKNGKQMFSELGKSALQFQYKMNEAFGTNKTQTLYMQGIFESMGETVGIEDKYSSIMSETMTKLTYDLASLYNKTEKTTAEAIRAGVYAGQTKPLRSYGIDVTQSSLQPIAESLGITESVKNMSQAEKEILRYIATLKQAKIAMGDLANTVESPSNQLKIFRQQLVEAKVALSSLFIGTFSKILPYANAILMVIKEVSKAIADMFGIELKDYNSGIASQEGIYDGIADSADDASSAVKELKRQTLGFDEIHNINENKDSGSNSGGTSGGIDQRLLDAIQGYDNGMDKVRMKATEIRDKIMEWLGFTKEIDPVTGEVSFKYGGIKKTLSKMWDSFKKLNTQGKILVGLGLVIGAAKLWSIGKKLVSVFGNSGLFKIIKNLYSPTFDLFSCMLNGLEGSHSSLKAGIQSWREHQGIIDSTTGKVDGLKGMWNGAKTAMEGLITGAVGLYTVHESMKNIADQGFSLSNSLGLVVGSLSTVASGVQIGAVFGETGAIIGGIAGAITGLIAAISGYNSAIKDSKTHVEEYEISLNRLDSVTRDKLETDLVVFDNNQKLVNELSNLVDANGKVQASDEARVNYILNELNNAYETNYKLIDGKITKDGKEVESIKAVQEEIKNKIRWMKLEAVQSAYSADYEEALKNEKKLKEASTKAHQEFVDIQNKIISKYGEQNSLIIARTDLTNQEKAALTGYTEEEIANDLLILQSKKNLSTGIQDAYDENERRIKNYQDFSSAILSEDYELAIKLGGNYYDNSVDLQELYKNKTEQTSESVKQFIDNTFKKLPEEKKVTITAFATPFVNSVQNVLGKFNKKTIDVDANTTSLSSKMSLAFENVLKNKTVSHVLSKLGIRVNKNGGVYSNGSWKNIQQYANGGTPPHGTLFWAGEAGAEVVAHANGKTEVLNQSQMASAIYSAVYSAMSQFNGGGIAEINVHADKGVIVETAVNGIQQHVNQTGTLPFTVPLN